MTNELFIERYIQGYLLSDIKRLNDLDEIDGPGNCGYVILQTVLGGCDLLGGLTSKKWIPIPIPTSRYFDHFLMTYMPDDDYSRAKYVLWEGVRNKVAHMYLTRDFIVVHKGAGEKAIVKTTVNHNEILHIYCKNLVADFNVAVESFKSVALGGGETASLINNNVQRIMGHLSSELMVETQKKSVRNAMSKLQNEILDKKTRASGASYSMPADASLSGDVMSAEEIRAWQKQIKDQGRFT